MKSKQELRGFLFMATNAFLLAVVGILFEISGLSGSQMSFATSAFGSALGFASFALGQNKSLFTRYHLKALLNGLFCGGATIFFLYFSMDLADPTSTTVVQIFTCIVIALAVEKFKYKKMPHWLSIISVITGFVGMATLCQKDLFAKRHLTFDYVIGIVFAIISGTAGVSYFSLVKLSVNEVPESWNWTCYMLGCATPSLPSLFYNYSLPYCDTNTKLIGLSAPLFQTVTALMAIKGFMLIKASSAFVFQFLASVLTFILQVIILPSLFSWFSAIGALLIISAIGMQLLVILKFEPVKNVNL
ncbi:uncharacterized protein LOC142353095 [Convolutriloba macropyga]|uniref:uncharacterized protein LOC142353095 n=1 Tax=Convolutriloba macropyga TaxID=536237 RepID=UPI003F5275AF